MAKHKERNRLKFLVDDGVHMNLGWALRHEEGRLLIDTGAMFTVGTELTLYPLSDDYDGSVLDFESTVVSCREDVCAPADAEHRFLVTLDVHVEAGVRAVLDEAIDSRVRPKPRTRRRNLHTHDKETLDLAFELTG